MQSYTDGANVITTASAAAAASYARGVELLIRSSPLAAGELRAAVGADSGLAVAQAALAVDARSQGAEDDCAEALGLAVAAAPGATRRERQHVEIVSLVLRGQFGRARALRAAHLAEFPGDRLIRHLLR